jgi:hypothetical protein
MTRFVTFGGQTQYKPGGLTKINANALAPIGISATGIVHLLGEADGGPPGSEEAMIIDDPALAKAAYRSGPLADAIRVAFGPSGDVRIPGGAFRVIAYKTNTSLAAGTQLPGDEAQVTDTAAAGSTPTVVNLTTGGLTPDAQIGRYATWDDQKRRIVDNDASSITVEPGFSDAPTATDPVLILESQVVLTAEDYGLHTDQVSVELEPGTGEGFVVTLAFEDTVERSSEIGGTSFLDIKYVGGPIFNLTGLVTAIDPTRLQVTTDLTAAGVDDAAGMILELSDGSRRLIASNTAGAGAVYTLDPAHVLTTDQETSLVGGVVAVRNVTQCNVNITGANGAAVSMTSAVLPTADDLAVTFPVGQTLRQFIEYLAANTNYEATAPDGVNVDTTLMSSFDFGTRATAVDCRFDELISPDSKGSFRRDLQVLVDWINDYSDLATAVKASVGTGEGSELPAWTGGVSGTVRDVPVYFTGGARGTSNNAAFQAAFDALLLQRGNHIVPLIAHDLVDDGYGSSATWVSVAAQLAAHVQQARGTGHNEMGGYIGYDGAIDDIVAQANALNDEDVQLIPQQMSFLDVDGNLTLMDEWASAVAAAGMRSGTEEVGEPLTFKFIKTSQLTQDSSWDPKSRTDLNKLLANGVMFAEVASGGIRWVRDITTYVKDDNIAFMDGNTREAVRFIAYDFRQFLEDRFTGLKATPATVASIRESAGAKLQLYLEDNIIVESLDPETETTLVPGFRNLRVKIAGNVATIRVEIFPCTGIVFQLNDIFLQLPRLAG